MSHLHGQWAVGASRGPSIVFSSGVAARRCSQCDKVRRRCRWTSSWCRRTARPAPNCEPWHSFHPWIHWVQRVSL